MRILVIGAVAAGTSAAAKARRNNDKAEIIIYEKDKDISYSCCGLPYYIGGEIEDIGELIPSDSIFFKKKYNIDIFTGHEVLDINPQTKEITIKNLHTNKVFIDNYDKLIIATGAEFFIPNVKGIDRGNVFFLRNVQSAKNIKNFIEEKKPQHAIIAGTGFIGFEMLENLMSDGINVTIVEKENKITPSLDEDMAAFLENALKKRNITIIKNSSIVEINEGKVTLDNGKELKCDMTIMATGVKPNIKLARDAGIEIGITSAIKVTTKMETNIKDIYACGDCIETFSMVTGKPIYRPLGSTANKTGRIAGDVVTDGTLEYRGNLSTGIFKIFNITVANTGLSEKEAICEGYDIAICHNIKPDKPTYFNGREMIIKAIADKKTERILGVQIIGYEGVDKRIDVFATFCNKGVTGNAAQNILINYGFKKVYNLSGGHKFYNAIKNKQ